MKISKPDRIVFLFLALCFFVSCANLQRESSSDSDGLPYKAEKRSLTNDPQPAVSTELQSLNPAMVALISQADGQEREGDLKAAEASLERALRISPNTPQIHYRLANVRLMQGNAYSALQVALKGQSLVSGDSQLAADFWRLIGDCHMRLGNAEKANEAYSHL